MTAIAYTPETYYIEYGQSSDNLAMRSEVINGSDADLNSTNVAYSANISGLCPFTQYYYRLVARNSLTTSQTAVQTFQTSEAGKNSLSGYRGGAFYLSPWQCPR